MIQLVHRGALLIHRKLRITNDVNEQDMRDLQLDFLFHLAGHMDSPQNARQKDTLSYTVDGRDQTWLESLATVVALAPPPAVEQLVILAFWI